MQSLTYFRIGNVLMLLVGLIGCGWFERLATGDKDLLSLDMFTVWVATPYYLLLIPTVLLKTTRGQALLFAFSLLMAGGGLFIYYDTTYLRPDPQGLLVFLFLPLWQLLLVLAVIAGVVIARLVRRSAANTTAEADARESGVRGSP